MHCQDDFTRGSRKVLFWNCLGGVGAAREIRGYFTPHWLFGQLAARIFNQFGPKSQKKPGSQIFLSAMEKPTQDSPTMSYY